MTSDLGVKKRRWGIDGGNEASRQGDWTVHSHRAAEFVHTRVDARRRTRSRCGRVPSRIGTGGFHRRVYRILVS